MLEAAVGASVGALFLFMFYKVVKSNWPSSYYTIGDATSFRISSSPIAYSLFRFAPVAAVAFFVASYVQQVRGHPALAVTLMVALHLAFTVGRAIRRLMRSDGRSDFSRPSLVVSYLFIALSVALAGALGAAAARVPLLQALLPSVNELSSSLWTALLAGVIGAFLVEVSKQQGPDRQQILRSSRSWIDDDLWRKAGEAAGRHGAEVRLVRAIMLVETLQRPPWLRRLERLKGVVQPAGSYGIMQVNGGRPLSDEESINLALEKRLRGVSVPRIRDNWSDEPLPDDEALARIARNYSANQVFIEMVQEAYYLLDGSGEVSNG